MKLIIREIPQEEKIHPDQAVAHLIHLCENFRMKYGNKNVVYLEMAIDAFQKYYAYELKNGESCKICSNTLDGRHYKDQDYKFCPYCGCSLTDNYE